MQTLRRSWDRELLKKTADCIRVSFHQPRENTKRTVGLVEGRQRQLPARTRPWSWNGGRSRSRQDPQGRDT